MRGLAISPRLRSGWHELGRLGRVAAIGVVVSAVVAVSLGFLIPRFVRDHILEGRLGSIEFAVDAVLADGGIPGSLGPGSDLNEFETSVRLRLLGGDTVRVKLWSPEGTILWSDEPRLIGRTFEFEHEHRDAFDGAPSIELADLSDPENELERDLGDLIEFYLPLETPDGVVGVFEVYQRRDPLDQTLDDVRGGVWLRIGTGLAVLAVFTAALVAVTFRGAERRRRLTEGLLRRSLQDRDVERTRIVTALHDDIGQPLYRLLYGLEDLESSVEAPEAAIEEIARLGGVVREVDRTLRGELRRLRASPVGEVGLGSALRALGDSSTWNGGPALEIAVAIGRRPAAAAEEALYRAAREAIENARRHSGASRLRLAATAGKGRFVVTVTDDGAWRSGDPGLGITTVRELLRSAGGDLSIRPGADGGTIFTAWVPDHEEVL